MSVDDFRKVLMKTGLVLVVLGHVSFIAAALLHGTVLRYVAASRDAVALQYCVVNILSVTSAIVVWPDSGGWLARGGWRGPERSLMSPHPEPGVGKQRAVSPNPRYSTYQLPNRSTSLCLSLLICKVGMVTSGPPHRVLVSIE